jgi:excisionase family DNA binding protein
MKNNQQSKNHKTDDRSEHWIKTKEACKYLGVSQPTLYRWIKSKHLNPKRTPTGEFRFLCSELNNLLA